MTSLNLDRLKAALAAIKLPLTPDTIAHHSHNPYGLRADTAEAVAIILNAAPALIDELERLAQDNRDKDAVIMSQEGQIERLRIRYRNANAALHAIRYKPEDADDIAGTWYNSDEDTPEVIESQAQELERLRTELDRAGLRIRDLEAQSLDDAAKYGTAIRQAKTLRAAERIERIAKDECGYIYEGRESHITAPDLLEIAAELRQQVG